MGLFKKTLVLLTLFGAIVGVSVADCPSSCNAVCQDYQNSCPVGIDCGEINCPEDDCLDRCIECDATCVPECRGGSTVQCPVGANAPDCSLEQCPPAKCTDVCGTSVPSTTTTKGPIIVVDNNNIIVLDEPIELEFLSTMPRKL